MGKHKIQLVLVTIGLSLVFASPALHANTWRLEKGQGLTPVSDSNDNGYAQAVANLKQLITDGKADKAKKAAEKLKKDFPDIAKPDFDAFMKAELLYAAGKYQKAVEAYNKFLDKFPQSEFCDAALDREFAIATAYLSGQKIKVLGIFKISGFDTGEKIMDKISDRAGDEPIAKRAALTAVEHYEKRDMFNDAYDKWSQLSSRWPTGQIGKDALLGMARCKHALYKGPQYNATNLISAKSYYESFQQRYPEDANQLGIGKKISQINEQLAYKQFRIGCFYQRTCSIEAANLYYNMVVADWPESTAAKMAKEQIKQEPDIAK
jgi:outer membrane protein assembly factor BamD (BamD/ComL family)